MGATVALRGPDHQNRYREADLRFHQVLSRMTGNLVYVHLLHGLSEMVRRSIAVSRELLSDGFARENLERHRVILAAIEAGDDAAARRAVDAHFALVADRLSTR